RSNDIYGLGMSLVALFCEKFIEVEKSNESKVKKLERINTRDLYEFWPLIKGSKSCNFDHEHEMIDICENLVKDDAEERLKYYRNLRSNQYFQGINWKKEEKKYKLTLKKLE